MNRRGSWTPYGAGAEAVRRVVGSKPTPGFRSSSKVEEKKEEMLRDMRGGRKERKMYWNRISCREGFIGLYTLLYEIISTRSYRLCESATHGHTIFLKIIRCVPSHSKPQSALMYECEMTESRDLKCSQNGGADGGMDMNVAPAWAKGYTGKGVVVTILDDGIQTNHPDLIDNYVSTYL
ncbi:unnamed protein product [Nesidiocoris tenuis]|uniref:Peptidase S8/S53 domain-containing protein n=1 Tax=Nesidiocoris tenuis TaxID=355587 RepID=A0A6H5GJX2_9HEMI|nr:unnamed protein product [Nesidiocoris tenuis]